MTQIELTARVGPDGILTLSVPVGIDEANREVKVVVAPADAAVKPAAPDESEPTVAPTAGARNGDEPGESPAREPAPAEKCRIADWIEPIEYNWNLEIFKAEQAVREYLKDSDADH
jgi:hypothetical protein